MTVTWSDPTILGIDLESFIDQNASTYTVSKELQWTFETDDKATEAFRKLLPWLHRLDTLQLTFDMISSRLKIREDKRKALIDRLTNEEKDLLGIR